MPHTQPAQLRLRLENVRIERTQPIMAEITYDQIWIKLKVRFQSFQAGEIDPHALDMRIESDGHVRKVNIGAIHQ